MNPLIKIIKILILNSLNIISDSIYAKKFDILLFGVTFD